MSKSESGVSQERRRTFERNKTKRRHEIEWIVKGNRGSISAFIVVLVSLGIQRMMLLSFHSSYDSAQQENKETCSLLFCAFFVSKLEALFLSVLSIQKPSLSS
jgi:hypothetical protein